MPAAAILCLALVLSAHGLRAEDLAAQLASTALALRDALPDAQRAELVFPFDDDEREDIRFAPFLLEGVRHGELAEEPRGYRHINYHYTGMLFHGFRNRSIK